MRIQRATPGTGQNKAYSDVLFLLQLNVIVSGYHIRVQQTQLKLTLYIFIFWPSALHMNTCEDCWGWHD